MVRVMFTLATWRRERLLGAVLDRLLSLDRNGLDVEVLVCGSEPYAKRVAHERGVHYLFSMNSPLGHKYGNMLRAAKEHSPDYVIHWSDDILCTANILSLYRRMTERRVSAAGFRQLWFRDAEARKSYFFAGYGNRRPDTIGAGRLLSAGALDLVGWNPWNESLERSLDFVSYWNTRRAGVQWEHMDLGDERIINVTVPGSITKLESFGGELVSVDDPVVEQLCSRAGY